MALASGASFGGLAITGRLAYEEGASAATMLLLRSDISVLVLWSFVLLRKDRRRTVEGAGIWKLVLLGGALHAAHVACFYAALTRIPVGVASLLTFSYPSLTAALGSMLRVEKFTALKMIALMLSLSGVALVLGRPTTSLDGVGVALALGSGLGMAFYVLSLRRVTAAAASFTAAALIMTGAAMSLSFGTLLWGDVSLSMTAKGWTLAFLHGGVLMVFGITTYIGAVRKIGPTSVAIADTIGPVVALLLAAIFLTERLSPAQGFGAGLVVLAALMLPLIQRNVEPGVLEAPRIS